MQPGAEGASNRPNATPTDIETFNDTAALLAGLTVLLFVGSWRFTISAAAGFRDTGFNVASLPNSLWAVGANALLQSWSQFAQTRDSYRAAVLAASANRARDLTQQLYVGGRSTTWTWWWRRKRRCLPPREASNCKRAGCSPPCR